MKSLPVDNGVLNIGQVSFIKQKENVLIFYFSNLEPILQTYETEEDAQNALEFIINKISDFDWKHYTKNVHNLFFNNQRKNNKYKQTTIYDFLEDKPTESNYTQQQTMEE